MATFHFNGKESGKLWIQISAELTALN